MCFSGWFRAAWWYKPEYMINELNINSVITTPGHDEVLPINALTTQRPYTIKGYAYSGESNNAAFHHPILHHPRRRRAAASCEPFRISYAHILRI
jgi:hypothetical protein